MKKKSSIPIIMTIFLILLAFNSLFAQEEPKTVTDFYLALPADRYSHPVGKEIKSRSELINYRKSLITVADIKNGYLKLDQNESEGWSEFALFKRADGSYLFAVSEISCGPGCTGELQFLTYKNNKWTDVTVEFAPKIPAGANADEYENYWKLPRLGRTLVFVVTNEGVKEEGEKLVLQEYKFEWNGTGFIRK
jgi:hypothetical protein